MRIVICTKQDLHGCQWLNALLPQLRGHEVAAVWLSDKTRPQEDVVAELAELKFIERTLPVELLFPLIDRNPEQQGALATFVGLARRYAVPIEIVHEVNGALARRRLAALAPDLVICARFSLLFDPETIQIPPLGIVNIHPGRLPEFAGLFAAMRAVIAGLGRFGCTLHWVDDGIDHGPIVEVADTTIDRGRSLVGQIGEIYASGIPALRRLIADCERGRRPAGVQQDLSRRAYRSLPGSEDFARFRRSGMRLWLPDEYAECLACFTASESVRPMVRLAT